MQHLGAISLLTAALSLETGQEEMEVQYFHQIALYLSMGTFL